MRRALLTIFLGSAFALAMGCDESADDVRREAESACPQPKPTCPARPCSPTPSDPWCSGGRWECEHDDPLACLGCNGVTASTYACRAWQCPSGTCPASDRACLALLCPNEQPDAGHDAGSFEPADAALDAPRDGSVD